MARVFRRNWGGDDGAKKRSAYWHLQYRDPISGRTVVRRTDPPTTDEREAMRQLAAAVAGVASRTAASRQPVSPTTMADVLRRYEDYLKARHKSTWRACGSRVREWIEQIGKLPVTALTKRDVLDTLAGLEEDRGLSGSTLYGYVTVLRAAIRRAVETGQISSHPLEHLRSPYRPGRRMSTWSDDQLDALKAAIKVKWARDVIDVLRTTGLRVSDAVALKWVSLAGGALRAAQKKTGAPVEAPLSAAALEVFKGIPRGESAYVFPAEMKSKKAKTEHKTVALFTRHFCTARKAVGLEHLSIHDIRRTFATRAFNAGFPAGVIASLLGHQSTTLVPHYAHAEWGTVKRAADAAAGRPEPQVPPEATQPDPAPTTPRPAPKRGRRGATGTRRRSEARRGGPRPGGERPEGLSPSGAGDRAR